MRLNHQGLKPMAIDKASDPAELSFEYIVPMALCPETIDSISTDIGCLTASMQYTLLEFG